MSDYEIISLALAVVTSIIALCLSLYTLYQNRKTLDVTWPGGIIPIPVSAIRVEEINQDENVEYRRLLDENNYTKAFCCVWLITNPSPHDIAYFDLEAIGTQHNTVYHIMRDDASLDSTTKNKKKIFQTTDFPTYIQLPLSAGVFKANSHQKFTIIGVLTKNQILEDMIKISFKIADKTWPWQNYKTYTNVYNMKEYLKKFPDYKPYPDEAGN